MELDYGYNPDAAGQADKQADKLTDSGAFVGEVTKAYGTTAGTGSHGIAFEFKARAPQSGSAEFTLWTHDSDGKPMATAPGYAYFNSLLFFFGLKGVTPEAGLVEVWQDGANGKREKVEAEGPVFPQLVGKTIGIVLQKELLNNGFRMNLYGVFDPTTRKTMTETRDNVPKAVKLDRLLKGLKDKDGRKKERSDAAEPGQPSTGADMSD